MSQRAKHLILRNIRVHLRQRTKRLAGTNLQVNAGWLACQILHTIGKSDRMTQVIHPVFRITRLCFGDLLATAVRHQRNLWLVQRDRLQIRSELYQDRFQHPGMRGNINRDALC